MKVSPEGEKAARREVCAPKAARAQNKYSFLFGFSPRLSWQASGRKRRRAKLSEKG
jgi:hypothetical protein